MKKRFDVVLFFLVLCLAFFGMIMIYSASSVWAEYKFHDAFKFVKAKFLFFLLGILLIFFLLRIDFHVYEKYANFLLGLCFVLLVLVLIPGIGTIRNGSRSWFGIGGFGIQPSEFAKIGLIIYVSKYLSHHPREIRDIKKGVLPIFLVIFFLL